MTKHLVPNPKNDGCICDSYAGYVMDKNKNTCVLKEEDSAISHMMSSIFTIVLLIFFMF